MPNLTDWIDLSTSLGGLQSGLQDTHRWSAFDDKLRSEELFSQLSQQRNIVTSLQGVINRRLQTVSQHGIEMGEVCDFFIHLFGQESARGNINWDVELFRQAVRTHDFGEVIHAKVGSDVPASEKTDQDDKDEYDEYCRYLARTYPGDEAFVKKMRRVFLLQFCLNDNPLLPQDIIADLKTHCRTEALMFQAIENWGYFLYALDQRITFRNIKIMRRVIKNHTSDYERLAEELPGFAEIIWTPEMQNYCTDFQQRYGEGAAS